MSMAQQQRRRRIARDRELGVTSDHITSGSRETRECGALALLIAICVGVIGSSAVIGVLVLAPIFA